MKFEIENLSFSYGTHDILKNISFTADAGDLAAVLGPNGVGKSTMFRCVLGFTGRYTGKVLCNGDDIKLLGRRELARRIAYIPQYANPVFNFEVLEIVMMGMSSQVGIMSMPGSKQRKAAMETLDSLGIAHLACKGIGKISGGERQLAMIARALVQKADILIMDEPTANLDYGNQYRVMARIRLLAQEGYTIIFSTHNPEHASLFANRAIVISDGEVLANGEPKQVLTEKLMADVYGIDVKLNDCQYNGRALRSFVPVGLSASDNK